METTWQFCAGVVASERPAMETLSWTDDEGNERSEEQMVRDENGVPVMETISREVIVFVQTDDPADALAFYLTTEEGQLWPNAIQSAFIIVDPEADQYAGVSRTYIPG
uniref:Uncharacterized protein n=1 Tax=Caulobacter sp. (strain K31) TaxID=366602 RepID=B0T616_CAUSK